jgi:DNA polymerase-3 subunit gamma/tau
MSYTVLARKWRPQQFDDVVGQGHVTRGLMNALSMGRVAHAFLFSGTRGVGKTTTARILAKALNCEHGPTPAPCGECDTCSEITQGSSVDVMEIDAASNRGIDNIRDLRETVKYAPAKAKYKVYIIDEVHMLTGEAFNALLKTLEEPPAHVVFVLATTDPHKLPATILSRCQHYDFRRVPKAQIEGHLKSLCAKEGINAEPAALARLAALAEGSVRDSLSLLDQVISYCGEGGVREADIDTILGLVGREAVKEAARTILSQDPAGALMVVDSLVDKGHDLRRFATELLGLYRDLMVCKVSKEPERALDLPAAEVEEYGRMAAGLSPEEIIRVMNLLARLSDEMKWAASPRISLELALVKAASRPINSVEDILLGIKGLKEGGYSGMATRHPSPTAGEGQGRGERKASEPAQITAPVQGGKSLKDKAPEPGENDKAYYSYTAAPKAPSASENSAADLWDQVRDAIKKMGKAPLAAKMKLSAPGRLEGGTLTVVDRAVPPFKPEELALINQAAAKTGGFNVKVVQESGEKTKSLAEVKKDREKSRREKIKEEALADPIVKSALDLFGGEIVDEDEKTGT